MNLNTWLKQLRLAVLLTLMLGTKLYGIPASVGYAISTEYGSWEAASDPGVNEWTMTLAGFPFSGACPMECDYDYPSAGGTSLDLQPEPQQYPGSLSSPSGICLAGVSFSCPSCYDVWINELDTTNGWLKTSDWEGGYAANQTTWNAQGGFNSIGPARSPNPTFSVQLRYNTNTYPIAIWCAKGPDGSRACSTSTLGYNNLPNDGITAAISATTNAVYMGTNYPVTFSFLDPNLPPTGAALFVSNNITTLISGTNCGTVQVIAITADPDPCVVTQFFFNITTCTSGSGACSLCNQSLYCDNPPPQVNSVELKYSLGPSKTGRAFLEVQSQVPDPSLGTPQSLRYNFLSPDIYVITNSAGWLRQVLASDRIVDITTNSASSYLINYYYYSNLGDYSASNGVYSLAGAPYRTVLISLPDGDTNHLEINDSTAPAVADYYWLGTGWSLATGNGLRNESLTISTNGNTYTKLRVIQNSQGGIAQQSTETWQYYPVGARCIQKTTGSGPLMQTETISYTADGMVQQDNHPDGTWDIYSYDALDRQIGHYSAFLNSPPTTNAALCRYTASTYDDSVVAGSGDSGNLGLTTPRMVVNYVLGQEVSRSYTVFMPGEEMDIQCVNPGAAWNDPSNLVTTTYTFQDVVNLGQPSKIINPDGTLQVFEYDTSVNCPGQVNSVYDKTTVWTGQADPTYTYVVDGTMDESWTDQLQRQVLHRVTDVASQIITDQEKY